MYEIIFYIHKRLFEFQTKRGEMMDVVLKNFGRITIKNAAKTEYGDIKVIFSKESRAYIARNICFRMKSAFLVECEFEWCLYIDLLIPSELNDRAEPWIIFDIENQNDIYRLNAFL